MPILILHGIHPNMNLKENPTISTRDHAVFRKRTFIVWIAAVAFLLALYFSNREYFDIQGLKAWVGMYKYPVMLVYFGLLSMIGLTLLPSTPFTLAGVVLFSPYEAYALNLGGILVSTLVVYNYARFLGMHTVLETRFPVEHARIAKALRKKELPVIFAWSVTPMVPTDLIVYTGSSLSVPAWKCVLGVLLGEGILNACYIFSVHLLLFR